MEFRSLLVILSLALYSATQTVSLAQEDTATDKKLVVATKTTPPFAMRSANDAWTGLSIELWRDIAKKLDLEFELKDMELEDMLEGVKSGDVDVAISAITVNPTREKEMDFTHTYFLSGLGLAVLSDRNTHWLRVWAGMLSWDFVSAVGALSTVLMAAALGVWFFERHKNKEQFGGKPIEGLGSSFWWSAVTMTTVGYGDKSPRTLGGRIVALVWMFASIIIISGFTAAIASSITVNTLSSDLLKSRDLSQLRIATVTGSTGATYAQENRLNAARYPSLEEALDALETKRADAVLYDIPLLKYAAISNPEAQIEILPTVIINEAYSIALPAGSALRERINVALLEILQDPSWQELRFRYLGDK